MTETHERMNENGRYKKTVFISIENSVGNDGCRLISEALKVNTSLCSICLISESSPPVM